MRLYTIPHTGTQFAYRLMYWRMAVKPRIGHLEDYDTGVKWIEDGHGAVTTLRNPTDVALSWLGRGKTPDARLWSTLAGWRGLPNVHVLQVDGDPDTEKRKLAVFLDYRGPLEWDWQTDVNTNGDPLHLKERWRRDGALPKEAVAFLEELYADDSVREMLTEAGYV